MQNLSVRTSWQDNCTPNETSFHVRVFFKSIREKENRKFYLKIEKFSVTSINNKNIFWISPEHFDDVNLRNKIDKWSNPRSTISFHYVKFWFWIPSFHHVVNTDSFDERLRIHKKRIYLKENSCRSFFPRRKKNTRKTTDQILIVQRFFTGHHNFVNIVVDFNGRKVRKTTL